MIDEFQDEEFVFGDSFLGFRFKTDDNLVYDEKINILVCVISLSSVIKEKWIHFPTIKLQKCLYESFFLKYKTFFVCKYKRWITLLIIKKK